MAIIPIPKPLRERLGEEGTEALIQVLNENGRELESSVVENAIQRFEQTVSREFAGVRVEIAEVEKRLDRRLIEEISGVRVEIAEVEKRFETRLTEEISGMRVEISGVRTDLGAEISGVRTDLGAEIAGVRADLGAEIAGVRADLGAEISGMRADLGTEIAGVRVSIEKSKSDTIRWMFLFWVGQIAVLVGIIFAFFK